MIRWCAYCQSYIGECAPFDSYRLTHGLCRKCEAGGIAVTNGISDRLKPLTDFFLKFRHEVRNGIGSDPEEWIKKAFALGIKPADLLIGIIQPALSEIGELWAKGKVTAALEHQFSSFAETMVGHVYQHYPELGRNRQAQRPDILLSNVDGNYHTLGLRFVEVRLLSEGLKTFTVLPGLPGREILGLISALKPRSVGLSVSMVPQVSALRELAGEINKIPEKRRPFLIAGGLPVKEGLVLPPELGVCCCPDLAAFPFGRLRARR